MALLTMLPVCSVTPTCYCSSPPPPPPPPLQIAIHGHGNGGLRPLPSVFQKECSFGFGIGMSNGVMQPGQRDFSLLKTNAAAAAATTSTVPITESLPLSEFQDSALDVDLDSVLALDPSASASPSPVLVDLDPPVSPPTLPSFDVDFRVPYTSSIQSSLDEFYADVTSTFNDSISKAQNAFNNSIQSIFPSFPSSSSGTAAPDTNNVSTTTQFPSGGLNLNLKDSAAKAALFAVDLVRRAIVAVEDTLSNGVSLVGSSYESAKQSLPPEIRDALNSSQESANAILSPAKIAFHKVSIAFEGLETSLGLDPNDPIIPFVLVFGTSATLWIFYWVLTNNGYAGDLSPQVTLNILSGTENALLVDIRPEVMREKDGVPDLRRLARFRYTSISIPEVVGLQRNSFKNIRDLEDALTAAVIRNLKSAQDRSKVIVLDADGTRSKGVARSLRKLGVKKPYLVQGGYQSWVNDGLRTKELKPETALTILNEEAEAILEEIKPTPLKVFGLGLGLVAASYVLLEWETTLQYIAVLGLAQTIFRRVATYESAEDIKKDVGLFLTPAKIGSRAFAWAAGKLETNRNGLPTSPLSSDVQNRVLQAAAKHESQPSDAKGSVDQTPESTAP